MNSYFQRVLSLVLVLVTVMLMVPTSIFFNHAEAVEDTKTVAAATPEEADSWFNRNRLAIENAVSDSVSISGDYTTAGTTVLVNGIKGNVNITVTAPASYGTVFIVLQSAIFTGTIQCSTGVDICIIISNDCLIYAPENKVAIHAPSSNVYITGGQDLTISGGKGNNGGDGQDSTDDGGDENDTNPDNIRAGSGGGGGAGGNGKTAVYAKNLFLEVNGCVTIVGGNGGKGGDGGNGCEGESSRYPASGGHGGHGGNGGDGVVGLSTLTPLITYKTTRVILKSGNGGDGGNGGGGGNGGDNTWGFIKCNGSSGGNGGNGGKGGNSRTINCLPSGSAAFDQSLVISTKGNVGDGGYAGAGGDKGSTKVSVANSPKNGDNGSDGAAGVLMGTDGAAYSTAMYTFAQTEVSKYEVWQQGKTWTDASSAAANAQTKLVSVGSAYEQANLNAMLEAAGQLGGSYWIGLKLDSYDPVNGSIYSWADGSRLKMTGTGSSISANYIAGDGMTIGPAFTNFNAGEPNNCNNNELYIHLTTGGTWNDLNNENAIGYITETSLVQRSLTVVCKDRQGNVLQTFTESVEEHYQVKAPKITGYTPESSVIYGTLPDVRGTIEIIYDINLYTVTIRYQYLQDNSTAAPTYTTTLRHGESLTVDSPAITGFKTDRVTVSFTSVEKNMDILVEYYARDQLTYDIFSMVGDVPIADVEVHFGNQVKFTDSTGRAQFIYTDDIFSVPLQLKKSGYSAGIYDTATDYRLNHDMKQGVISMRVDTLNHPDYSVQGISCYGNDILNYYGVINVKYDDVVPVEVQLNLPEYDNISKVQLVQEVPVSSEYNGDQTVSGAQEGKIRKILKTVQSGDSELSDTGKCTFRLKGTEYTYDEDMECLVYIYLYTEHGTQPVIQQLNISIIRFAGEFAFKGLFEEAEVSLEDTGIDFLSGVKISFKSNEEDEDKKENNISPFPIDLELKNNEVYISYNLGDKGLDMVDSLTHGTLKPSAQRLNTAMESLAKKADQKFNEKFSKMKMNTKAGFELSSEAAGGLCIAINGGGNVTVKSYLRVGIAANASWNADFTLLFIPITVNVTVGAEGELLITGLGYDFEKQEIIRPAATATVGLNFGVSGGLGTRNVSVGGFCRLSAKLTLVIGETTYFDKLVFNGEWGVYAKLKTLWKTLYTEKAWTFLDKTIDLKNKQTRYLVRSQDLEGLDNSEQLNVYDLDAYVIVTEEETPPAPQWTVPGAQVLEDTSVEFTDTKMVQVGDIKLAVYFAEDLSADPTAAKMLVYRVYQNYAWSDALPVEPDGTGDSEFDLIVYNNEVYLVYTEANAKYCADDYADSRQLICELTNAQDITVAKFDTGSMAFTGFTALTQDHYYDSMPGFGIVNNQLYLAWNKNTAQDDTAVFGSNTDNDVYCRVLENGQWTQPRCLIHNCHPITDMQVAQLSGNAYVALCIDEDANLYTEDDRNLYLVGMDGDLTYVNCYGASVQYLQPYTHNGKTMLLYSNGQSVMTLDSAAGKPYAFSGAGMFIGEEFKVMQMPGLGATVMLWSQNDVEGQEHTVSRFYGAWCYGNGAWTDPLMIYEVPYHISDWDGVLDGNHLQLLLTDSYIQVRDNGTNRISLANKLCFHEDYLLAGLKARVEDVCRSESDGKTDITYTVKNNGFTNSVTKQVTVMATAKSQDATLLSVHFDQEVVPVEGASDEKQVWYQLQVMWKLSKTVGVLSTGASASGTVTLDVPEGIELADVVILLEDYEADAGVSSFPGIGGIRPPSVESVPGPQESMTAIGMRPDEKYVQPELVLAGEYLILGNREYISLRLENQGLGAGNGQLQILRLEADGTQTEVFCEQIVSMQEDHIKYYLVKLEKEFFEATYQDFICKVVCENDLNQENNAITVNARKLENQEGTQVDLLVEAPELSVHTGTFDKNPENRQSLELDITITDEAVRYVGCVDGQQNVVDLNYTESNAGKNLHVEIPKSTMAELSVGSYEYAFMFVTERGYIDGIYHLQVVDTTPVSIAGQVTVVDEDGIPVIGAVRGQVLKAVVKDANTEYLRYQWIAEDQVVAEGSTYCVDEQCLGKPVQVCVTGYDPYYGKLISQEVFLEKQERFLCAPAVERRIGTATVKMENIFHVGDDALLYGYATENDSNAVTQWQEDTELTFPVPGEYYLFAKADDSDIYLSAVSEATLYVLEECACVLMEGAAVVDYFTDVQAAVDAAGHNQYVRLLKDWDGNITAQKDLYLDLAGHKVTGTVHVSKGAVLYGMDSTTDDYDSQDGYGTIANIDGQYAKQHQVDTSGISRRYLTIAAEDGISFHRFYIGMVKMSLRPGSVGFGYRAVFYADAAVQGQLDAQDAFGYGLWVTEGRVITRSIPAQQVVSGREVTLLLKNIDPYNHGQTDVHAYAYIRLADGTRMESSIYSCNLRQMLELIAANLDSFSQEQILAVQNMCLQYACMESWNIAQIYNWTPEEES